MQSQRADAHKDAALAVDAQSLLNALGHGLQILGGGVLVHLVDQGHILLAHTDDEIVLAVRVQALDHVHRHRLQSLVHRSDHEDAPGRLRRHVQLLGPHVNITDQNVVGDDVLDEGTLVVLLLIIALGRVQGHRRHGTYRPAHAVVAAGKHRVVKVTAPAGQRLERPALQRDAGALGGGDGLHVFGPLFADARQFAACNNGTLRVKDADGAVRRLLELQYNILKNSSRHNDSSCEPRVGILCNLSSRCPYYIVIVTILQVFFSLFNKISIDIFTVLSKKSQSGGTPQ